MYDNSFVNTTMNSPQWQNQQKQNSVLKSSGWSKVNQGDYGFAWNKGNEYFIPKGEIRLGKYTTANPNDNYMRSLQGTFDSSLNGWRFGYNPFQSIHGGSQVNAGGLGTQQHDKASRLRFSDVAPILGVAAMPFLGGALAGMAGAGGAGTTAAAGAGGGGGGAMTGLSVPAGFQPTSLSATLGGTGTNFGAGLGYGTQAGLTMPAAGFGGLSMPAVGAGAGGAAAAAGGGLSSFLAPMGQKLVGNLTGWDLGLGALGLAGNYMNANRNQQFMEQMMRESDPARAWRPFFQNQAVNMTNNPDQWFDSPLFQSMLRQGTNQIMAQPGAVGSGRLPADLMKYSMALGSQSYDQQLKNMLSGGGFQFWNNPGSTAAPFMNSQNAAYDRMIANLGWLGNQAFGGGSVIQPQQYSRSGYNVNSEGRIDPRIWG